MTEKESKLGDFTMEESIETINEIIDIFALREIATSLVKIRFNQAEQIELQKSIIEIKDQTIRITNETVQFLEKAIELYKDGYEDLKGIFEKMKELV